MKQWDDLRLFLAVAKNGTLTGAADELELNVATLHRRLKSFEEGFGISLFEKGPRGYRLTNAGEALLSHTKDVEESVFAAFRAVVCAVGGLYAGSFGVHRVGIVDVLAAWSSSFHTMCR